MSSGAPARSASPQRTIGEILLENGYVDQEHLDRALERQQETGLPLGQILVEAGAITRLELASALAVQWSDMPIAVRPEDEGRRYATAEDRAERTMFAGAAFDPARLDELTSSVRRLEARLDGLDGRDDLAPLHEGIERLDARLASTETRLAEAAERAGHSVTSEQLEERVGGIARAVEAELVRTPAADPSLGARLDEIAQGLASLSARADELETGLNATRRAAAETGVTVHEATAAWASERAALERRVTQLAARVERVPTEDSAGAPVEAAATDDLNRLWFAVERISLQLTEHHRDIDSLLAGSDARSRVEELAARLHELEERGGSASSAVAETGDGQASAAGDDTGSRIVARKVRELEQAARAEHEKLLTQIEQMFGSLEWRLQRLESGTPAPARGA